MQARSYHQLAVDAAASCVSLAQEARDLVRKGKFKEAAVSAGAAEVCAALVVKRCSSASRETVLFK